MPRRSRIIVPNIPLHVIQRGNNRQTCFFAEEDYLFYLEWLREYARSSDCSIHSYVLMTNHVHILLTPRKRHSAGDLMKRLGQRYVQYVNRTYKRSGTLWEGRFRSSLIQQENSGQHPPATTADWQPLSRLFPGRELRELTCTGFTAH